MPYHLIKPKGAPMHTLGDGMGQGRGRDSEIKVDYRGEMNFFLTK